MKQSNHSQPPKLLLNFFRRYCREDLLEEIEGDLIEQYQIRVAERGEFSAKIGFAKEVLLLFRPSVYGNLKQLFSGVWKSPAFKLESLVGYLFIASMVIVSREYKDIVLYMFSVIMIYFTAQRLIRKKRQDHESGTNLFEKDLKAIGFRMMYLAGMIVAFYLLIETLN